MPISGDPFRDSLAVAAAHGSRQKFSALVEFAPEIHSGQSVLKFLEMAILPTMSLSSSRIEVQHTFSYLTHDDEVEKWRFGGDDPGQCDGEADQYVNGKRCYGDYPRRYGGVAIDATADVLLRLSESALIERVEEDTPWQMNVDRVGRMVNCDLTSRGELTGRGVRVAVIDTGIDESHPAFAGRISKLSRSFGRRNEDMTDIADEDGHGTHVAGIIGGNGKLSGIAPGVELLVLKVRRSTGKKGDVARAVSYARDCKADIINISGARKPPRLAQQPPWVSSIEETFVERAVNTAIFSGSALTVAAGNYGIYQTESTILDPGISQHALTVGSVDLDPQSPHLSSFSSRGPAMRTDGIQKGMVTSLALLNGAGIIKIPKPDIVAPGGELPTSGRSDQSVLSAKALSTGADQYVGSAGTSMACPVVAGIAALIIEYSRRWRLGLASHEERAYIIHNLIRAGARDLNLAFAQQGYGLVDWDRILAKLVRIQAGPDSLNKYINAPIRPR